MAPTLSKSDIKKWGKKANYNINLQLFRGTKKNSEIIGEFGSHFKSK